MTTSQTNIEPNTSTRETTKQERREKILEIASTVFASTGYANTDVQLIADMANVGKGTVYRHFESKQKLFLAASRHCLEEMGKFVESALGGKSSAQAVISKNGIADLLKQIAVAFARYYELNPHAIEIFIQERAEFRESVFPSHLMYRAETRLEFDQLIEASIAAGEIRQLDSKDITDGFADLLFGSVITGVLEGSRTGLVDRVTKAAEIFIAGIVIK